ncbi:MAG: FAD-binding oxidoreductase [Acidimicrobiales bacterium]
MRAEYRERVAALAEQYRSLPAGAPVRLAKRTSNLFRPRSRPKGPALDVAAFDGVLEVDPDGRTADVLGMTTYEHLVDATLPHGLMPLVVPELKTITLGGAVTGLGIESSSWRNGMPHESVQELDVLTGGGLVVTARPDNEHRDLFFGFPNSYGTLGYALRARIELEAVAPWVHLRHLPFASVGALVETAAAVCQAGSHDGEEVAFVDGVAWGVDEAYLTLGSWTARPPRVVSRYTSEAIYYRSIQARPEDWLTVRDYLWRWDTDWFWCSRAFGVQRPWVRRLLGPRWLRSDTYWRLLALEQRWGAKAAVDRWLGHPAEERVVQDVQVPVSRLEELTARTFSEIGTSPVWLCPLRTRDDRRWPLYPLDAATLHVNVGLWSAGPIGANRWVEDEVDRLGGRKSLYSTVSYDRERFWEHYNGPAYRALKARYDPDGRLLDLYQKCALGR